MSVCWGRNGSVHRELVRKEVRSVQEKVGIRRGTWKMIIELDLSPTVVEKDS